MSLLMRKLFLQALSKEILMTDHDTQEYLEAIGATECKVHSGGYFVPENSGDFLCPKCKDEISKGFEEIG